MTIDMVCPYCNGAVAEIEQACPHCGISAPTWIQGSLAADGDSDPVVGPVVLEERYRVDRLIARGGMGTVFEGTDLQLDRKVAIKILAEQLRHDKDMRDRFLREARSAASLDHPNIVTIHAFGQFDGKPFIVMKYIGGKVLTHLIIERGQLPLDLAASLAGQVCDGLDHIHAAGFVHRDIKPRNLMVDPRGRCTILDFGVLRIVDSSYTQSAVVFGTAAYMAPEQARDPKLADARSDLYGLGISLFEMLTGRVPFHAGSTFDLLMKHSTEKIPLASSFAPKLPPEIDEFLNRALAKDPAQRFQSGAEFKQVLNNLTAGIHPSGATQVYPGGAFRSSEQGSGPQPISGTLSAGSDFLRAPTWSGMTPAPPTASLVESPTGTLFAAEAQPKAGTETPPSGRRKLGGALVALLLLGGVAALAWYWARPPAQPVGTGRADASPSPGGESLRVRGTAAPRAGSRIPARQGTTPVPRVESGPGRVLPTPVPTPPSTQRLAVPPTAATTTRTLSPQSKARPSPRKRRHAAKSKPAGKQRGTSAKASAKASAKIPEPKTPVSPTGRLRLRSIPPGARVRLDGRVVGSTPLDRADIEPGSHEIRVDLDGYRPWTRSVAVAARSTLDLNARLGALPGKLHVVTVHAGKATWANITIDGSGAEQSHTLRRQLSAGRHRVRVSRKGYRPIDRVVDVPAGREAKVTLVLERAP